MMKRFGRGYPRRILSLLLAFLLFPALSCQKSGEDGEGETLSQMFSDTEAFIPVAAGEVAKEELFYSNPDAGMEIALTFDDGPHGELTPKVLDLLSRYGVVATFFVVGENVEIHPELVKRCLELGHEVGNHTYTHADLSKLTYRQQSDEVLFAENVIFEENEHRPVLLRPPGGLYNKNLFRLAQRFDYTIILWSLDTRDWAHTPADSIVEKVLTNVKGGDVILFHDYIVGESHTLSALERIIPELLSRGYRFVTVSELFRLE